MVVPLVYVFNYIVRQWISRSSDGRKSLVRVRLWQTPLLKKPGVIAHAKIDRNGRTEFDCQRLQLPPGVGYQTNPRAIQRLSLVIPRRWWCSWWGVPTAMHGQVRHFDAR